MPTSPEEIARILSKYRPLRPIIKEVGPPPARRAQPVASRFPTMVEAIVYQQLAGRAASAIHGRFVAALGGQVTPEGIMRLSDAACKECGLSDAKRDAIRDLAAKVLDGTVRPDRHGRMSDQEVVNELVLVRGIGPWTAQMYLMSQLGRHDVWPILDFGVRNGWSQIHGMTEMLTVKELAHAADHLSPFRSSVAWYCWQAVDLATKK